MKNRRFHLLSCAVIGTWLLVVEALAAPRIGLLWWPADPGNPANPLIESLEACLVRRLELDCPGSSFVGSNSIRDALFPLMEPATQPATEAELATLLTRDDIRLRLMKRIDFLVAFSGGTVADYQGAILCGAGFGGGGCLGFAWINKDTRVAVTIWDLAAPRQTSQFETRSKGTTLIPAFILPVPLPARTEADACRDMSREIAAFMTARTPGAGGR